MKQISLLLIFCLMLAGCRDNSIGNQYEVGNYTQVTSSPNTDNSDSSADDVPQITSAPVLTAQKPVINGDVVEITESLFIAQLNDVYLNQDDYLGKTVKYEGMFMQYSWDETNMTYYLVYRNSPGCCGADGQAGFEVIWLEGSDETYPSENDWCEVIGTLETYDEDGQSYLHIVLESLTVLDTRGAEYVSQ